MKKIILAAVFITTSMSLTPSAVFAQAPGGGGASPLGESPDQYITIAERQQRQRLRATGKTKSLYSDSSQRLRAIEEDKWFQRQLRKQKR